MRFVVECCNTPPVLEFVEEPLDEVALSEFGPVIRDRIGAITFSGDGGSTLALAISSHMA